MRPAALLALLVATGAAAQVGPAFKPSYSLGTDSNRVERTFWDEQPARLAAALAALKPQDPARRDVYILSVAAGGAQPLFDHEAKIARDVLSAHYGESGRTVVLSNRNPDNAVPLANPANLTAAITGIARILDPAQDLLVVYLTAHGGERAVLETNLPGPLPLPAINAIGLARALDGAGIKRRVILISACFAGSWTPALASDTTIVIAAARRDRTSFGCEMDRKMSYFGEALLAAIKPSVTLAAAFTNAKRAIAAREAAEKLTPPSEPQSFVGAKMTALWGAPATPRAASAAARHPARPQP